MAEPRHMALPMYATPPGQTPFVSPTDEYHLCQLWPGWECQMLEPVFSSGNSAASISSVQWDAERQSHQSFEATRPAADYSTANWAPQPGDWPPYQPQQQHLQPPQSAVFSPPHQWPAPACSPFAMAPVWQPPPDHRNRPEPERRATATKKKATKPTREAMDPRLSSTAQHRPKKARVGAGCELSPASSLSNDENAEWAEDDVEGEDSDASLAPPGLDRKKTYRVKNRAAAKRCREKTKQYEVDLANKEKQVTQERIYLDACVTALKNEVLTLKNQILQHGSCDCEMIQGYIARTASTVSVAGHRVSAMPRRSA
ncbi:basic region leucine zipper [Colletotrichum tofieldiae]|nr:basic region leucine zipper [Colletotrichum tofieldiae]GKT69601.1 basic region leucine zipper [Colletotrichum tofieldiae]